MKKLDIDLTKNPFFDFQSSRYSISAKINVQKAWKISKEKNYSFFIISLGCLMKAVNSVSQLKQRIIDDEAVEFDYLNGVTPIMDKNQDIYKELLIKPQEEFNNFNNWHDYVKNEIKNLLTNKSEGYTVKMNQRDFEPIANFSCIPWLDFESITTCVENGKQIQPLITWGKVNNDYEMTVAITVSHIFVNGREIAIFYKNVQDNFNSLHL